MTIETFQFLSDVTQFLDCFLGNYHKFELLTFARKVSAAKYFFGIIVWVMLEIYFSFDLSSSEKILKIR